MCKFQKNLDVVLEASAQYRYYKSVESMFEIDQWAFLPQNGNEYRQKMIAFIANQKSSIFYKDDVAIAYNYFEKADLNSIDDDIKKAVIQRFLFQYKNATKADQELTKQFNLLRGDTMKSWKKARECNDWSIFLPYLKKVFELKRDIALSIDPSSLAIDTLVGMTDEGISCKEIDTEFDILKNELPKLMNLLSEKKGVLQVKSWINNSYNPTKLETFSKEICKELGYSEERGGYNNKVIHGFTSFVGPQDARINTYSSDKLGMIFTYIHECGHAMYANSGNGLVNRNSLWGGIEGGFHEAIARFYENMVGRSLPFWEYFLPKLKENFLELRDVTVKEFYENINMVQSSNRRIGADEITYSLHGIIRYELERDCLNGEIKVEDLRDAWNDKYNKYLNIKPASDVEGILQDMHWAGNYIGYFQSYVLGNIYDGQIFEVLRKEYPNMYNDIKKGDFFTLNNWMVENIYQYGCSYTSTELIQRLSKSKLDAKPFLSYLKNKYSDLYSMNL